MDKLPQDEIDRRLTGLSEWSQLGDSVSRTFQFANFVAAMAFVNRVAEAAEEVQHHPDVLIRYNKVTLTLSTHDASGLTAKDFDFADRADQLSAT